ncbi:coiled-coil domain-containing protein [Nocardiopsis lucentensis]|uniref:hypothetical protein n=1 Tax=Nocardiopsis lucentensis TaxID=53441 RepID=UPI00034A031C|nr:hypothetical protein [Nocardiopsis lucentensis]
MYELSRVRLFSIGPKGARYQDVTLDLRNVGAPVPNGTPASLFELDSTTADASASLRRPSPATVLFLENGGGKSVLIKLIFSVMLPGRRQVVGSSSSRLLENFVQAHDVAHVALEWQHFKTGQRVVVGKVSTWRGQVVSSDPSRLLEAWYSFRPTERFNLDCLPLTEGRQTVSMTGFRSRLEEAGKVEPHLETVWTANHGIWRERLTRLGIDPELFRYQRRMNAGEGEAADAFTFKSDEAFVDWLLTAVTDEESVRVVGDVVEQYATRLAQRGQLISEREFVSGALDQLHPLAEAAQDRATVADQLAQAQRRARAFAIALKLRREQELDRLGTLKDELEEAAEGQQREDRRERRLNRITIEMRRARAELRWKQACAELERLEALLDEARDHLAAWQATGVLIAYHRAHDEAEQIRSLVSDQEQQAAPLLEARERAAHRLVRGLAHTADQAQQSAEEAQKRCAVLTEAARQAEDERVDEMGSAESERARARRADTDVETIVRLVKDAVSDSLLTSVEDDVSARADQADTVLKRTVANIKDAEQRMSELATALGRLRREIRQAGQTVDEAKSRARAAEDALVAGEGAAERLRTDERLAALLGTQEVDPELDAPSLIELLTDALDSNREEQARVGISLSENQRVLDALGSGGLLPPSVDVTDALNELEAAGIHAWSGWLYLSTMRPEDREPALRAHPDLVGGVVLNNADHIPRAKDVLTRARLLPRTVVAVGTTAQITTLPPESPVSAPFLVPPNPAMYDEEQAEHERQRVTELVDRSRTRLGALTSQAQSDRELLALVSSWSERYPPGTLSRLREEKQTAEEALAEAKALVESLETRSDEIEEEQNDLREVRLPSLRADEEEQRATADRLLSLAAQADRLPGLRQIARQAWAAVTSHTQQADEYKELAERHRRDAHEAQRDCDDSQRAASTCREEMASVPGSGSVDDTEPVPEESISRLRDSYRFAREAYEAVRIGADLRDRLNTAEKVETQAQARLEEVQPARILPSAERLLATPDGTDVASRAAATDRARRIVENHERDRTAQAGVVGQLENEFSRFQRQEVTLEPHYSYPTSIAQAEELVSRAETEFTEAHSAHERAKERHEALKQQTAHKQELVDRLRSHLDVMDDVVPSQEETGDAEPFTGTSEQAGEQRTSLVERLREAETLFDDAARVERRAADRLAQYASDERFAQVDSPVRRQIISVPREQLPDHAGEWESALRPRLRSLSDELTQLDRHRAGIIERLRGMVEKGLHTLRNARRLSKLPEGLGDWGGQEFLRITYAVVARDVLDDRLGTVIDEAVAPPEQEAGRKRPPRSNGRRDGLTLLLRGVRAATPKGIKVEILKPDAVLRTERVRVSQINDIFSGGQLLTAAIIIYCTMAALRANARGHTRQHSGVLFLDNPIGRASAGYLIELQMAVAKALGVQLIYTTGLFDTNALAAFPLIIRLRNDADLRAGLVYLSVHDVIRAQISRLGEPDGTGSITASRVYARSETGNDDGEHATE